MTQIILLFALHHNYVISIQSLLITVHPFYMRAHSPQ